MAECGRHVAAPVLRQYRGNSLRALEQLPPLGPATCFANHVPSACTSPGQNPSIGASPGTLCIIRAPIRSPWAASCQDPNSRCLTNSVPARAIVQVLGSGCFSVVRAPRSSARAATRTHLRVHIFRHLIGFGARQHRLAILDLTGRYLSPCAHLSPPIASVCVDCTGLDAP